MRHRAAVALLKSGADLSTISYYLGHTSLTTTNRDAKVDLAMTRQAIARVQPITPVAHTWGKTTGDP